MAQHGARGWEYIQKGRPHVLLFPIPLTKIPLATSLRDRIKRHMGEPNNVLTRLARSSFLFNLVCACLRKRERIQEAVFRCRPKEKERQALAFPYAPYRGKRTRNRSRNWKGQTRNNMRATDPRCCMHACTWANGLGSPCVFLSEQYVSLSWFLPRHDDKTPSTYLDIWRNPIHIYAGCCVVDHSLTAACMFAVRGQSFMDETHAKNSFALRKTWNQIIY